MKSLFRLWVIGAMVVACLSGSAQATESASRPATKADLVGQWKLVSVRPVHDKNDPTFFPHQRFQFFGNASMKFISSENPLTKEWQEKFNKQPAEIDYTISDKGLLTLTWSKLSHSENALCTYVLKDVPADVLAKVPESRRKELPKAGNLTLSFLNTKGRIAYQKVLEKIN